MKVKPHQAVLGPDQLAALRAIDACTVANAIEIFHERVRNEGFTDGRIRCVCHPPEPMLGYAATVKIRGSAPPTADGLYSDRTDWWDYIRSVPAPRVLVVQDAATRVGLGSLLGGVHMNILRALGCVGALTNGSVRDLPEAERLGFYLFSGDVTVSHAYVHIIEFGQPVEVAGLKVRSGDLLHGDQHGVQTIPLDIADKIPAMAARIAAKERTLIQLCQSPDFSIDKLRAAVAPEKF
jgi:regulator of RNase E activity RraA